MGGYHFTCVVRTFVQHPGNKNTLHGLLNSQDAIIMNQTFVHLAAQKGNSTPRYSSSLSVTISFVRRVGSRSVRQKKRKIVMYAFSRVTCCRGRRHNAVCNRHRAVLVVNKRNVTRKLKHALNYGKSQFRP